MNFNPTLLCDFYKISHREQYPEGTEYVYSTLTPRSNKYFPMADKVLVYGFQYFVKEYLIEYFNDMFFSRPKTEVIRDYRRILQFTLSPTVIETKHIEDLHDLGYLPIKIKALPEGTFTPIKVPVLSIENTKPEFFWLTNYFETLLSSETWGMMTSATVAAQYYKIGKKYSLETTDNLDHLPFQFHDFSFRGMRGLQDATLSGSAHLIPFVGTDTIPSIMFHEKYYGANVENELVGTSIPATEHSVMCSYGNANEFELFKRLITKVYPSGFFSVVSDTWDFWKVVSEYLPALKDDIMKRDGRVVIRPDSGDPVEIICGKEIVDFTNVKFCDTVEDAKDWFQEQLVEKVRTETPHGEYGDTEIEGVFKFNDKYYKMEVDIMYNRYDKQYYYIDGHDITKFEEFTPEASDLGLIETLWNIFGGTVNEKGYKVLDAHIGAIYGDSISLERAESILSKLQKKGFAASNIVFGIGSYSYVYYTRDSLGFAIKAVHAEVDGEERNLFKDPKTDDGTKKSSTGRMIIRKNENLELELVDGLSFGEQKMYAYVDEMQTIFMNGKLIVDDTLSDIRERFYLEV